MDYEDQVYSYVVKLKVGRYPLKQLRERDRFTTAVKYLIDGEWLTHVEFSADYSELIIKPAPDQSFISSKEVN